MGVEAGDGVHVGVSSQVRVHADHPPGRHPRGHPPSVGYPAWITHRSSPILPAGRHGPTGGGSWRPGPKARSGSWCSTTPCCADGWTFRRSPGPRRARPSAARSVTALTMTLMTGDGGDVPAAHPLHEHGHGVLAAVGRDRLPAVLRRAGGRAGGIGPAGPPPPP